MNHAQKLTRGATGSLARLAGSRSQRVVTKFDAFAAVRHSAPSRTQKFAFGTGAVGLVMFLSQEPAACMAGGEDTPAGDAPVSTPAATPAPKGDANTDAASGSDEDILNTPMLKTGARITFGGIVGYCSGYAVKKVGKVAVVAVGVAFIGLQTLRYFGYIDGINWDKVRDDVVSVVDTDGTGSITRHDLIAHWRRFIGVMSYNIPGRAAFAGMALLGFKQG